MGQEKLFVVFYLQFFGEGKNYYIGIHCQLRNTLT